MVETFKFSMHFPVHNDVKVIKTMVKGNLNSIIKIKMNPFLNLPLLGGRVDKLMRYNT